MPGLYTGASGLWGGFPGLLYSSSSLSTPPGLLADAAFSPAELFTAGEPGGWYDPSDISTMYQDGAGTTPVTAVEQPVGLIYDKSKGAAAGPELVTNGNFSAGSTGWTLGAGWSVSGGVASVLATGVTTDLSASINTVANRLYIITITISNYVSGAVTPRFSGVANSIGQNFPASNGTFYQQLISTANNTNFTLRANGTANFSVDDISVREIPGNHLFQFTPGAAPVLSARVNILEKTESLSDAYWTKSRSTTTLESITPPSGASTVWRLADNSTTINTSRVFQTTGSPAVLGRNYRVSFYLKAGTLTQAFLRRPGEVSDSIGVYFDTSTGATTNAGGVTTSSMTSVGDGWWYCQAIMSAASTAATYLISLALGGTTVFQLTAGTQYVFISGVDMREATLSSSLPPYQSVNTSTSYQASGFPYYLKFDGIDDFLVTTTITPGIDEVQVFTGMRKLSDVNRAIIVESSTTTSNNGTFSIEAPSVAGQPRFSFFTRGTASVGPGVNNAIYGAPTTRVVTGIGDISAPNAAIYMDNALALQSSLTQGTGNYLAYPVYVGARAGSSFFFDGNMYSLIFRFGANLSADAISNTQNWINQRTFAY